LTLEATLKFTELIEFIFTEAGKFILGIILSTSINRLKTAAVIKVVTFLI